MRKYFITVLSACLFFIQREENFLHLNFAVIVLGILVFIPFSAPIGEESQPHRIVYLTKPYDEPRPLSLMENLPEENGLWGARLAIKENNLTGRFAGKHKFELVEKVINPENDIAAEARNIFLEDSLLVVADLEADDLLAIADLEEAKEAVIMSIRTSDDRLRGADCRFNVFHTMSSWAMRADAIGQYLAWKK